MKKRATGRSIQASTLGERRSKVTSIVLCVQWTVKSHQRNNENNLSYTQAVINLLLLSYLHQPFKVIVSVTSCVFSPGLQSTTLWMEWRSEHSTKHLGSDLMSWYSDRWGFYFLIASSLRPLENHSIDPLNRSNNVLLWPRGVKKYNINIRHHNKTEKFSFVVMFSE